MLYIDVPMFAEAIRRHLATAYTRLRGLPYTKMEGAKARFYPLVEAVLVLKKREVEDGAVERLTTAAIPIGDGLCIGPEALSAAVRCSRSLDWEAAQRLSFCQAVLVDEIAAGHLCCSTIVQNIEALRALWLCVPEVSRFVLSGGPVPDLEKLSTPFVLASNGDDISHHIKIKNGI